MKLTVNEAFELRIRVNSAIDAARYDERDKVYHEIHSSLKEEGNKAVSREINILRNQVVCEQCREAMDKFYLDGSL